MLVSIRDIILFNCILNCFLNVKQRLIAKFTLLKPKNAI